MHTVSSWKRTKLSKISTPRRLFHPQQPHSSRRKCVKHCEGQTYLFAWSLCLPACLSACLRCMHVCIAFQDIGALVDSKVHLESKMIRNCKDLHSKRQKASCSSHAASSTEPSVFRFMCYETAAILCAIIRASNNTIHASEVCSRLSCDALHFFGASSHRLATGHVLAINR